jgi:hypothetical protein
VVGQYFGWGRRAAKRAGADRRERIFDMREFYEAAGGRQPVDGLRDPFADRPPWFVSIGRCFVSLRSLLHLTPLEHEVPDESFLSLLSISSPLLPFFFHGALPLILFQHYSSTLSMTTE